MRARPWAWSLALLWSLSLHHVQAQPNQAGLADDVPASLVIYRYDLDSSNALADLEDRLVRALRANTALTLRALSRAQRSAAQECSGEPQCLAKVVAPTGSDGLLLVVVSQLGEVTPIMSRINVRTGQVMARMGQPLAEDTVISQEMVLSWLQNLLPAGLFKRYASIKIETDVAGAQVYLNAARQGVTPLDRPLRVLAPATYQVRIEKAQHLPFLANLTVLPDAATELRAPLPRSLQPIPAYKRWYLWATIGAGVALAAGGTALYLGLKAPPPDRSQVPAVAERALIAW